MGLTLLSQPSLPISVWDHAFHIVVHLINRLPSSALSHSIPFSALFHKDPDYLSLKVFGCACYAHIHPYNTHKLQFRSTPYTFLGYSSCHKGYECLDVNDKLFISKDVLFDEMTLPFATKSPTSPSSSHTSQLIPLGVIPNIVGWSKNPLVFRPPSYSPCYTSINPSLPFFRIHNY